MRTFKGNGGMGKGYRYTVARIRQSMAILITVWFMILGVLPMMVPATADSDMDTSPVPRSDLNVAPNTWSNISNSMSYDKVTVGSGAILNVLKSGTLTATDVNLAGGSLIINGEVNIIGGSGGKTRSLHGYGPYLEIGPAGSLHVTGSISGTSIGASQGGNAIIDFKADDHIMVLGDIIAAGSTGANADGPWQSNGVSNYVSAGGSADISLQTRMKAGSYILIRGDISGTGGSAGKAADALGSASGGYSNGGLVDGNVGAGGDVNITIKGYSIDIRDAKITGSGGKGGKAGNGASSTGTTGGGGGGYAGGDATTGTTGNGVAVADRVGSGGWVTMDFFATSEAVVAGKTTISGTGGQGGAAGVGGRGGSGWSGGGGGGGGYGGGGGATGSGGIPGEGTTVIGYVASGGKVTYNFEAGDTFSLSGDTVLTLNGGKGGNQPDAAGGGSGAAGGSSGGAGGGGGYGGGGGGAGWNSMGGSTVVAGRVGDGGDVTINFDDRSIAIGKKVNIYAVGGSKGNGVTGTGAAGGNGATGGQGSGKNTIDGNIDYQIPMISPYLISPKEGSIMSSLPTFKWDLIHDTGPSPVIDVKSYTLEVDNNSSFDSPEIYEEDLQLGSYTPDNFPGGQYWWRVKAKYGSSADEVKTSTMKSFYYNKAPTLERGLPPIRVDEDHNQTHYLNLDEYFTDDLYPDDLVYDVVEDIGTLHEVHLGLDGTRNQWIDINLTNNFFGQEYFNISATDDGGLVGYSGILSVIVLPVNDPPMIRNLEDQLVTEDEESILFLSELLYDEESWNPMTLSGTPIYLPSKMSVETDSDYIRVITDDTVFPPTIDLMMLYTENIGSELVTLTVSDGFAETEVRFYVNVSLVNDPPQIFEVPPIIMLEDTPKSINLNQYALDEEDPVQNLTWKVRAQDRRLLDLELEEGNLLRIIPKPELSGQSKIYFTVADSQGAFATIEVTANIKAVNDPPAFNVESLNVPKGIEYPFNLTQIVEDVDSPIEDLEILDIELVNNDGAVSLLGLQEIMFNFQDDDQVNDTLIIHMTDGSNSSYENLTLDLGFAPTIRKIPKIVFLEDVKQTVKFGKFVEDKDSNLSDMDWQIVGFDPSFIDPEINPVSGKMVIKAYESGSGSLTLVVTDPSGFVATQDVKVLVEQVTFSTTMDRNPGILGGILLLVIIIVLISVLIVTSKRFGFPFKGMKKKDEDEAKDEGSKVMEDGTPPPPEGWIDGQGWSDQGKGTGEIPDAQMPLTAGQGPVPTTMEKEKEPMGSDEPAGPDPTVTSAPPDVPKGLICVRCKGQVPKEADHCPTCGISTDKDIRKRLRDLRRKERRGNLSEEEEEELTNLEEGIEGSDIDGTPSQASSGATPDLSCPQCGEVIEPDFIKCPSCNASLEN